MFWYMEEGSSPKIADQSLGSDGASPFTNTSTTSEDSGCGELSSGLRRLPRAVSKHPSTRLIERTGYSIVQFNGQKRYGPPPDWEGEAPSRGCEVFVGKIPRDCFEEELVPVFEKMGKIYELRLMMEYPWLNEGYAFVVYGEVASAKESVRQLNNYEIRKGRKLVVSMRVDNCRLYVGRIPKYVTKEDVRQEVQKVTEGVVDVLVYPSQADKTKNRGYAFVEYDSHRAAAMARRKLMNRQVFLWGRQLAVDWAELELEVDEEIMAQVKALHIRNLMFGTTEDIIEVVFSMHGPVDRVKKIRDYAFVHFHSKEDAHEAMKQLNGSLLDGAEIEVTLAKPVNKYMYPRNPKFNHVATLPTVGFNPLDTYGTMIPAIYPRSYPMRNSMGMCTMLSGNRGFLPIQMVKPNQRQVMPTPFYFFAKQSEEPLLGMVRCQHSLLLVSMVPLLPLLGAGYWCDASTPSSSWFLWTNCCPHSSSGPPNIAQESRSVLGGGVHCSKVPSSFPAIAGQPLPLTDSHAPPSAAFSAHVAPPKPLYSVKINF